LRLPPPTPPYVRSRIWRFLSCQLCGPQCLSPSKRFDRTSRIPSATSDLSPLARHLLKVIRKAVPASPTSSALHRLVRLLRPLLTSAVPSRCLATPVAHPLPGAGRQTSQGKTRDLRAIYLSHLRPHPPGGIGLWEFWLPRPDADASYALAVRQAGTLLTASFRLRLATTPLLFG
jgi:hypothetical protein